MPPPKDQPPPLWIRGLLMFTCTGVSFFHGSNDGQKGIGLLMLILIGILPGTFSIDPNLNRKRIEELKTSSAQVEPVLERYGKGTKVPWKQVEEELTAFLGPNGFAGPTTYASMREVNRDLLKKLDGKETLSNITKDERKQIRRDFYLLSESIGKIAKVGKLSNTQETAVLANYRRELDRATKFIPALVKVAVALALGLGTMIGWKRIVVTVGEKIGKEHLTYAQGAAAELVAMGTIGLADAYNLPVSTTHVLSSGVAGTMAANHSGLNVKTLRNLLLAWVLTLPVCVLLGAGTFAAGLVIVFNVLGLK